MDRRHLLVALAATCVAAPALAQQTQSSQSVPDAAHQMGEAETKHLQQTLATGSVALETSRIAREKAQNADVKQFAQFEIAEQETIAEILRAMVPQGAAAPQPDAKGRELLQQAQQAKAGKEFDRDYVAGQIDGHRQLLAIQEDYLKNGRNREHVAIAKLARGMIKEHLTLLETMQKELGRG